MFRYLNILIILVSLLISMCVVNMLMLFAILNISLFVVVHVLKMLFVFSIPTVVIDNMLFKLYSSVGPVWVQC